MAAFLDDALRGRVFAERYRVEDRIGDGAMGVVYRARHVRLARSFAIKVLHPKLLANDKILRRFEREAELAAKLRHDNVIGVVDAGETPDGLRYLVMDIAEGEPLSLLIAQGPMPAARVLRLAQQLCDGLQHAHDHGLIHRDFKPDNVIVQCTRDGIETPRIVDFGIALLRDNTSPAEGERLTTAGIVLGTPHYMAPEHASGSRIDHRIDLFALGVICFEMLTGRLPFDGDGPEVARANIMFETPRMNSRAPGVGVDPLLEELTRKLMARSLDERIPSARHARALLDAIERDREAARMALGLAAPPRPMLALPIVTAARQRPPNTTQPDAILHAPDAAPHPRRKLPVRSALAAVLPLAVVAMFLIATHEASSLDGVRFATDHAPPAAVAAAPPDAMPAMTVERDVVETPPPPAPPPPKVVAMKLTKQLPPTMLPAATPLPPTTFPAPVVIPSAAELAEYYALVGRKLSALEKELGQEATFDLWPRYRIIRIQALLLNADDRLSGARILEDLEREIDAISAVP